MLDTKAIALALAPIVKQHVEAATAPLLRRIDELEAKAQEPQAESVLERLVNEVAADVRAFEKTLSNTAEGSKADLSRIEERVHGAEQRMTALEEPRALDLSEIDALVADHVSRAVAALPSPENGKDADMEAIKAHCAALIDALPAPQPGKDGCDAVDALQDKDGNLIISFSDGRMKNVGRVAGKDGDHGSDGQSWDAMDVRRTGPRTIELSFDGGEQRNTFELEFPVPLYRGVFSDGAAYEHGDMVTWAGSLWHCNDATSDKPGEGAKAWTLAAKRGRDGKDFAGSQAKPGTVKI